MISPVYVSSCTVLWTVTIFCWQIGLSADGMLEGIKMTYYSDLGNNPADSGLSAMVLGMDNGQLH